MSGGPEPEARKRSQEDITSLLLRLTKVLRICKRKVDTMSPKVFRPSVLKLREAVNNTLCVAERLERVTVSTTCALKRATLRAAAISDQMYIPTNMQTSSLSCFLIRLRNLMKLASRTATLVEAYTEKLAHGDYGSLEKERMMIESMVATEVNSDSPMNEMDVNKQSPVTDEKCEGEEMRDNIKPR